MEKLKTSTDVYERQQIFYALNLAVQNPNALPSVGQGWPVTIEAFPPAEAHDKLKTDWLKWWGAREKAVAAAAGEAGRAGPP